MKDLKLNIKESRYKGFKVGQTNSNKIYRMLIH